MRYDVVENRNLSDLKKEVNNRLSAGNWFLIGGLIVDPITERGKGPEPRFYQTMIFDIKGKE
jgi:hypothetical protein